MKTLREKGKDIILAFLLFEKNFKFLSLQTNKIVIKLYIFKNTNLDSDSNSVQFVKTFYETFFVLNNLLVTKKSILKNMINKKM